MRDLCYPSAVGAPGYSFREAGALRPRLADAEAVKEDEGQEGFSGGGSNFIRG